MSVDCAELFRVIIIRGPMHTERTAYRSQHSHTQLYRYGLLLAVNSVPSEDSHVIVLYVM